jgi:hypothetical protein
MSILVRFEPKSVTSAEQYDETIRRLEGGSGRQTGLSTTCASSRTETSESARSGTLGNSSKHSGSALCPF